MNSSHRLQPFDELARLDEVLTRIDPALGVDVFNSFMTHSLENIAPPLISVKKMDGVAWSVPV